MAPQKPQQGHTWDPGIYANNLVSKLGNLIPLPLDINNFVDNKNWPVKFIHYSHVGIRNDEQLQKLSDSAKKNGIVLSQKSTQALSKADHSCAVEPILKLAEDGSWDVQLTKNRTKQIKELAWVTLFGWLNS